MAVLILVLILAYVRHVGAVGEDSRGQKSTTGGEIRSFPHDQICYEASVELVAS